AAFASVYEDFEQDARTKGFIETIEQLKRSTAAEPGLTIPSSCSGSPPQGDTADPVRGTWQTDHLSETQIVQAFVAAGGSEKEGHSFFSDLAGAGGSYAIVTLKFQDGQFTEFESADGGPLEQGYI